MKTNLFVLFLVFRTNHLYLKIFLKNRTKDVKVSQFSCHHVSFPFLDSYFKNWKIHSLKTHNMHRSVELELQIFKCIFLGVKKLIFVLLLSPTWPILRIFISFVYLWYVHHECNAKHSTKCIKEIIFHSDIYLKVFVSN